MESLCINRGRSLKLKLIRNTFTDLSTTGKLTVDDEYFSFTLEDTDRKMEAGGAGGGGAGGRSRFNRCKRNDLLW